MTRVASRLAAVGLVLSIALGACRGSGDDVALGLRRYASVASTADEFATVFGREPTAAQANGLSRTVDEAIGNSVTVLGARRGVSAADQFMSALAAPADEQQRVVTLIGHNAGGSFRFPDGSAIDLTTLATSTSDIVAVVSCESARFVSGSTVGIPTPVTYRVAFATEQRFASKVSDFVADGETLTVDDAKVFLEEALDEASTEQGVRVRYTVAAITGGGVSIAIWQELEG